jgi:hypothetical protein
MSKAFIWLTSNKSAENTQSGTLFSPSLMAVLAKVVANIAGVRPKYCNNAAAAIAFMISSSQAGSEVCQQISSQERGSLARTIDTRTIDTSLIEIDVSFYECK